MKARNRTLVLLTGASLIMLAGCSSASDPFSESSSAASEKGGSSSSKEIVVGSQQYYSNEIVAEIYAQTLEHAGAKVDRQFKIGQREVYLPELEDGRIDLIPEYGGNLLQYYSKDSEAKTAAEIGKELESALPQNLRPLKYAPATDQDSYNVTKEFADQHGLTSLKDLAKVPGDLKLAANSEIETRPYGPEGLQKVYGVKSSVVPVEDSGGPLTVKALTDGTVQLADIYSADPSIASNKFVTLSDPKNLVLPQQVTPIASGKISKEYEKTLNSVSAKLTTEELTSLNGQSVNEEKSAKTIAADWLKAQGLV